MPTSTNMQSCTHLLLLVGLWWWRWEWSLSRIPAYLPLRMLCKVKKKKKVFKAKYRPVQALSRRGKKTNMFRPNSILQVRKPAFIRHVGASAVAWQQAVQMGSAVTRHAMQMADSIALGLLMSVLFDLWQNYVYIVKNLLSVDSLNSHSWTLLLWKSYLLKQSTESSNSIWMEYSWWKSNWKEKKNPTKTNNPIY